MTQASYAKRRKLASSTQVPKATWSRLSFELQCRVLSFVPTSAQKLALRFVAKSWAALLDSPNSHGRVRPLETRVGGASGIPPQLLQHVRTLAFVPGKEDGCSSAATALSLLPQSLEELTIEGVPLKALQLPYLPRLQALFLYFDERDAVQAQAGSAPGDPQLNPGLLPALQRVSLSFEEPSGPCPNGGDVALPWRPRRVSHLCARLSQLKTLELFEYAGPFGEFPDLALPDSCQLRIDLMGRRAEDTSAPPFSVQDRLTELTLSLGLEAETREVSLAWLAGCQQLGRLDLDVGMVSHPWSITGLSQLPATLHQLTLLVSGGHAPGYELPAVQGVQHLGPSAIAYTLKGS